MRSSIFDLGSNTFHLLVADVDAFGVEREILDHKIAVRIADSGFARLDTAAYARGLAAIEELVGRAGAYAEGSRAIATGVFREAANGAEFVENAAYRTGLAIEVIDGAEEARLTWLAVSAELAGSHGRLAVLDLGGGSLEIAVGTTGIERAHTFPLGTLRLRGLSPVEIRTAVADAAGDAIRELRALRPDTIAISSGTARALLRLSRRFGLVADGQRHLWRRTLAELARRLPATAPETLLGKGVPSERVDTIAAGAVILNAALEPLERPAVYVARSGLRQGALIDLARRSTRRAAMR